ncbi:MAG: hypothetical protein OEL76_02525 [Siculibacillus sp.]|nr:hypothetical protein [Siculibacillus sp.]
MAAARAVRETGMIVFGNNYGYGNTRAAGESYGYAAKNLLALTRNNSAGILDQALTNLAEQSALFAEKSSSKSWGNFVDIFV